MKSKIQHTTKLGIKKKIDLIEPKPNKVRVGIERKPPLKSELIAQNKALQIENDTLKHENMKNLTTIKNLEEEVSSLKKPLLDKSSKGAQTFSSEIIISCNVCIFEATCEEELNWHMGEVHEQSDESYFNKDFYCDICKIWFDKENDLSKHKKNIRRNSYL